jgi:hypothetical protein
MFITKNWETCFGIGTANQLEGYVLTHEIYKLLETNYSAFSSENFDKLINWIENLTRKNAVSTSEKEKEEALLRKKWLKAVVNSNNAKIKTLYEKYQKINPVEIEHPDYPVYTEVALTSINESKPFPPEILEESNEQVAEYLKQAKGAQDEELLEWYSGVLGSFRQSVVDHYQKFSRDLSCFLAVPGKFQYGLISGLAEAARKEKEIAWGESLAFTYDLVNNPVFWGRERSF